MRPHTSRTASLPPLPHHISNFPFLIKARWLEKEVKPWIDPGPVSSHWIPFLIQFLSQACPPYNP